MSKLYWLLNLGLVALLAFLVEKAGEHRPQSRWTVPDLTSARSVKKAGTGRTPTVRKAGLNVADHLDVIWERSLFRPDRTELDPEDPENQDKLPTPPETQEMELIGIGVIKDRAAAIILIKEKPVRRVPRRPNTPAPEEEKPKSNQHVYRIDAEVGETGYVVKEITLNQVVLQRGSETKTLELKTGDSASVARRETAAKEDAKRAPVAEPPKTVAVKPPPRPPNIMDLAPPPPPPAPVLGGPPGTGVPAATESSNLAEMSKEERIRRALEARKRILERRNSATGTATN